MSKKDLPEVEISEFDKFELFVTKHYKSIVLGAMAIIVAVGIGVIVKDAQEEADKEVVSIISKAQTEEELIQVIQDNSGHRAVGSAQLRLAKIYFDAKKYDEVASVYNDVLASDVVEIVKTRVKLNLAALKEVQGESAEAQALYEEIAANATLSQEIRDEADYSVARILVANKKLDDAKNKLTSLVERNSFWAKQADMMLKRL